MRQIWLNVDFIDQFRKKKIISLLMGNFFDVEEFQGVSSSIIGFFAEIFPFFHALALTVINISLLAGGIIYLLDERDENGKEMIIRSVIMFILYIFIFNDASLQDNTNLKDFEQLEVLTSFISLYLLFILAVLALIIFIGTCGLYIINPNPKLIEKMRKSLICFFAVIIPLGINFPNIPQW